MNRTRTWFVGLVLAGLALYAAHWAFASAGCGGTGYSAVQVDAIDAQSGDSLPYSVQHRGTVIVRGRQYADSGSLYMGAGSNGRGGIYNVVVRVPGYQEWSTRPVIVWPAPCGVTPVQLKARLKRASQPELAFVRWPLGHPPEDRGWPDTFEVRVLRDGELVIRGSFPLNAGSDPRAEVERSGDTLRLMVWGQPRPGRYVADETRNGFLAALRGVPPGGYQLQVIVHSRVVLDHAIRVPTESAGQ